MPELSGVGPTCQMSASCGRRPVALFDADVAVIVFENTRGSVAEYCNTEYAEHFKKLRVMLQQWKAKKRYQLLVLLDEFKQLKRHSVDRSNSDVLNTNLTLGSSGTSLKQKRPDDPDQ